MIELTIEEKAELFDKISILIGDYKARKTKLATVKVKTVNELVKEQIQDPKWTDKYWVDIVNEFRFYWENKILTASENRKLLSTFDLDKRLNTWKINKETNFWRKPIVNYESMEQFDKWMREWKQEEIKIKLWSEKFYNMKNEWKDSSYYLK